MSDQQTAAEIARREMEMASLRDSLLRASPLTRRRALWGWIRGVQTMADDLARLDLLFCSMPLPPDSPRYEETRESIEYLEKRILDSFEDAFGIKLFPGAEE